MRYALDVQYIGKSYAGSQIQFDKNGIEIKQTIQGELERGICTLLIGIRYESFNRIRPVKTVFSGRTDRGVNAKGQVIHFDWDNNIVASKFVYQLNEILPPDISVSNLRTVPDDFHAQKSAKKRYYRYEFINRKYKQAFDRDLLRVKYPVNPERMQESLNYLLGEHDFSAFKSSGTLNPSKVCTLYDIKCSRVDDSVFIDITGNRFLYNMVRTIVGTLLKIEGHNLSPVLMKEVLEAKDRSKAGQTVSPYGLTLMKVDY